MREMTRQSQWPQVPGLGGFKETKMFLPHSRVKVSIVGSLRDREVACSASDRQGSNFESCVWRTVSSHSSHYPQEVLLAQFSLYVHKGGLKPDSFHFLQWPQTHCLQCVFTDLWAFLSSFLPVFRWYLSQFSTDFHVILQALPATIAATALRSL